MGADRLCNTIQLFLWESPLPQELAAPADGIWNVIPLGKLRGIVGPVAQKDTQVMHPGSGKKDVIVKLHPLANLGRQSVKARLVPELVRRLGFGTNVRDDRPPPVRLAHTFLPGQRGVMRIRSSPPRSWTANTGDVAGTATIPRSGRSTEPKLGLARRPHPAA